jgi:hypothetical protein
VSSRPQSEHGRRFSANDWIERHLDLVALVVVAVGFLFRFISATQSYLDPDEAWNYMMAHQANLAQVYRVSLTDAHPPLFVMVLFFWRLLGNSELVLRLISVLAGTATVWFGFKWLACRFGPTVGFTGLLLLSFCPTLVSLSSVVRNYAILLLAVTLALYCLERGLREKSEWMLLWSGLALLMANLTHYSATWFTIAVGLYGLIRIVRGRLPGRWIRLWVEVQFVIVALWVLLYLTYIRTLRGGGSEQFAREVWLRASYFHPRQEGALPFLVRALGELFAYLCSSRVAGLLALGLFLAGVAMLLIRHRLTANQPSSGPDPRRIEDSSFGILLIAPFAINAIAALAGLYPLGGTRHNAFLILFVIAGISLLLGRLAGRRLDAILLAAVIVVPIWHRTVAIPASEYRPSDQKRELMVGAVDYIRDSIPVGSLLFVDWQTAVLLGYYLGRDQIATQFLTGSTPRDSFLELHCGGYRVVSHPLWAFTPNDFWSGLRAMKQHYGLEASTRVWVVNGGRRARLSRDLAERYPQHAYPGLRAFGRDLSVFQVQEGTQ